MRRWVSGLLCFYVITSLVGAGRAQEENHRWWPVQQSPEGVISTITVKDFETVQLSSGETTNLPNQILVHSVAGLAARAVQEGRCDEMVWIDPGIPEYDRWYEKMLHRLQVEQRAELAPWALVERFMQKGIIKGYVLYRYDTSEGRRYEPRENVDESVNVATSAASLYEAVLVEEGQENRARDLGLKKLFDAREMSEQECFEKFKDHFNRRMICTADPKTANCRGMAIAHKAMTVYGVEEPLHSIMAWLEPGYPVLGWNVGDEYEQTVVPTEFGHFQTATNWCWNLPLLSADSQNYRPGKISTLDPLSIDWDDPRHTLAFLMSDGDNVQWLMGNFTRRKSDRFWHSPAHGNFPFSWSNCSANLAQLCPEVIGYLASTQPPETSLLQCAGGYYYPDLFGNRHPQIDSLKNHARRVGYQMKKAGLNTLFLICRNLDSEEAMEAYRTYAREIEDLLGIAVVQYHPYDEGGGKVFWVEGVDGLSIPVVTCRYTIWANATWGPRVGDPLQVAKVVNESAGQAASEGRTAHDWVAVHSWSRFKAPGKEKYPDSPEYQGVIPAGWCVDRLREDIKVVSMEELFWRIRMEQRPKQTRRILHELRRARRLSRGGRPLSAPVSSKF
jgi:hypothetical protein